MHELGFQSKKMAFFRLKFVRSRGNLTPQVFVMCGLYFLTPYMLTNALCELASKNSKEKLVIFLAKFAVLSG